MELFIINTYLSLLIFNPLEAAVLFLAATGDFKLVFSRKFIKHWFILGSINFIFQYLASCLDVGFFQLFFNHINSIIIMSIILKIYNNLVTRMNIKLKECFYSAIFNAITILLGIMIGTKIFDLSVVVKSVGSMEIIINLLIKLIQFLLLYIFFWRIFKNEKFCKKFS